MNSEEKKRNRCSIKTFYAMNHEKGKVFTFNKFKKCGFSRSQIFRIKKCLSQMDMSIVTGMFDRLKDKIHKAKEEGLGSLI